MMGAVLDMANAVAPATGPVTGAIVIGVDYAPAAKVTMLLFCADGTPRLVAKLARRADGERALTAEHDALASLWSDQARTVTAELPKPLALRRVAGRLVLLATAVRGTALTAGYYTPGHVRHRGPVARDFAMAGSWLDRFQRETRSGTAALGPRACGEWIGPAAARYRAKVGWSDSERVLFTERLPYLCGTLAGVEVPVVAVHGDYAPGNILLRDGRVSGVVDWELGREAGLPFSDVFKFAASYGSYLDRASPGGGGVPASHPGWGRARDRWGAFPGWPNGTGVMYAFFGSGWFPGLVREFLRERLNRLAVPAAAAGDIVRLFLPLFVAEQALALEHPVYRDGYRTLLRRVAEAMS